MSLESLVPPKFRPTLESGSGEFFGVSDGRGTWSVGTADGYGCVMKLYDIILLKN